jgi:2-polyprenyl-6-methoxyphenol hydroxylase-like FAD-dependent oxidoreductase
MPDEPINILIAGGGIAGPALAYWLSRIPTRRPLAITVLERSATPRPTGQAIDIRGPAVAIVRRMGLEAAIRACGTPERGFQKLDTRGRVVATFDASGDADRQSFTSEYEILRADLARLCCEAAAARPGVAFVYGDYIRSVSQPGADGAGRVRVDFTNGKLPAGEYDLVVGADGMVSRMRPHVTGRPAQADLHDVGSYIAYFTVTPGGLDSPTHARIYNAPRCRNVWLRPSSAGTGVYLSVARKEPALLASLSQDAAAQKAALTAVFADSGLDAPRLMAGMHAADDFYFQQIAQVRAERWTAGRIALVGDAGYCPSPITGMGTSLALHGGYVLAGELINALGDGGDGDIPRALESYERRLRPYVTRVQELPPGAPGIIHPSTNFGIWVLDTVCWLVYVSGVIKLASLFSGTPKPKDDERLPEYGWVEA